jgi:hypothetical protein
MKIQRPSIGRVVIFARPVGLEVPALVVRGNDRGEVDILVCGEYVYGVAHDNTGTKNTWRYPPRVDELIDVSR